MTWVNGFWFAAGALCALGAGLLLLPALRSAPAAAARARVARWSVVAGAGGIAVVVALYLWLGRPELIGASSATQAMPQAAGPIP